MCMHDAPLEYRPSLSPSQIADLRLAASQMSGPKRRAFEAEMAVKYCGGNPLLAETPIVGAVYVSREGYFSPSVVANNRLFGNSRYS